MREEGNGIPILALECPAQVANCQSSLGYGGISRVFSACLRPKPVL